MATDPLNPKPSSDQPHYIFVFPNFYSTEKDLLDSLNAEIPIERFSKIFNSIFKIIEEEGQNEMLDISKLNRHAEFENLKKRKRPKDREFSESFKAVKESRDSILKDTHDGKIRWGTVLKIIVENLLIVFEKDLHLEFELFFSRDKDEIFMKIRATETNLRIQADLVDYQVQIAISRPKPEVYALDDSAYPKSGFSYVSPYGEFQFKELPEDDLFSLYKTYDNEEAKAKDSKQIQSVFKYKDKVQLVTTMISSVMDLGELLENQIITKNFCLHNEKQLEELREDWGSFSKFYKPQNISFIRRYFGEKIGMYFAYIQYYIYWLVIPSLIGLSAYLVLTINKDAYTTFDKKLNLYELNLLLFSLFLSLGSSLLDQLWIRKENILAWNWGTSDLVEVEQQRPAFKGEYRTDPITGIKKKIQLSIGWERFKRVIGFVVTLVITAWVLFVVLYITLGGIQIFSRTYLSLFNAMHIKVMNFFHRIIARKLTEWENYEYDSQFNNALTVKLYLFQFVNSYASLFIIAFVKDEASCTGEGTTGRCMKDLQKQLFWILILNTFLNFLELGWPYFRTKISEYLENRKLANMNDTDVKRSTAPASSIETQSKLAVYETPLDDYMELIINYGYVVMFSVACPLFPLFSLILNILEVRVDSFKLCYLCQRPYPTPANSIGTWISIIRTVSLIGALTNTAILVFTADVFDLKKEGIHNYYNGNMWLYFVLIEHGLLITKYLLIVALRPIPRIVKEGLIWSKRLAAEVIYGKASNLEHQREIRNLKFRPSKHEHFVLKPEKIREGNID